MNEDIHCFVVYNVEKLETIFLVFLILFFWDNRMVFILREKNTGKKGNLVCSVTIIQNEYSSGNFQY